MQSAAPTGGSLQLVALRSDRVEHPVLPHGMATVCPLRLGRPRPPNLSACGHVQPVHPPGIVLEDDGVVHRLASSREQSNEVPDPRLEPEIPQEGAVSCVQAEHAVGKAPVGRSGFIPVGVEDDSAIASDDEAVVSLNTERSCELHLPHQLSSFHVKCMHLGVCAEGVEAPVQQCRCVHQVELRRQGVCDPRPQDLPIGSELVDAVRGREVEVPLVVDDRPAHHHGVVPAVRMVPAPSKRGGEIAGRPGECPRVWGLAELLRVPLAVRLVVLAADA
mmetsp:Transcript_106690/g.296954  ORF Transcript_106690/g.296954 Transcript_106690/m.296954 type:complete len:276 (-) Transcript_106690:159-986(-)